MRVGFQVFTAVVISSWPSFGFLHHVVEFCDVRKSCCLQLQGDWTLGRLSETAEHSSTRPRNPKEDHQHVSIVTCYSEVTHFVCIRVRVRISNVFSDRRLRLEYDTVWSGNFSKKHPASIIRVQVLSLVMHAVCYRNTCNHLPGHTASHFTTFLHIHRRGNSYMINFSMTSIGLHADVRKCLAIGLWVWSLVGPMSS